MSIYLSFSLSVSINSNPSILTMYLLESDGPNRRKGAKSMFCFLLIECCMNQNKVTQVLLVQNRQFQIDVLLQTHMNM